MAADPAARALREAATRRLAFLDQRDELNSEHVRLIAAAVGKSERTVWRWVTRARVPSTPSSRGRRFEIDDRLRVRLAYWRGNAAALHRELLTEQRAGGPKAPSVVTIQRAIRRDLTHGDRAGLRKGERDRRKFDVFLQRPPSFRNAAWEADHVEAPVEVEVDGRLVKPWVTWLVDAAHNAICGTAVTPGYPSREASWRRCARRSCAMSPTARSAGCPRKVRIDQGKDFLSGTVSAALGAFAVRVTALPGYTPHLKGSVETLNGAAERMLFAEMPRYTHAQTLASGARVDPDAPPLRFEAFVAEVLTWTDWWNTQHEMEALGGQSPATSWLADPSPIEDVDATSLWMFTLEDEGRYAAATTVAPAKTLKAVTAAEAAAELDDTALAELSRLARSDLFPPTAPAPGWVLPVDLDQITAHGGAEEREMQ